MPADEVESGNILINERVLTASVNDIEHNESQSLDGVWVNRIYFQLGAKFEAAEAQVTASCQTVLKIMPGITPRKWCTRYVTQLTESSATLRFHRPNVERGT